MPKCLRIFNTYRNRYIGRFLQECGVNIIPSMAYLTYEGDEEYLFAGVPEGCPCLSYQVHCYESGDFNKQLLDFRTTVQATIRALQPRSLIVYGGNKREDFIQAAAIPKSIRVVSVADYITERRPYLAQRQKTSAT
jgi:hypothetical protein